MKLSWGTKTGWRRQRGRQGKEGGGSWGGWESVWIGRGESRFDQRGLFGVGIRAVVRVVVWARAFSGINLRPLAAGRAAQQRAPGDWGHRAAKSAALRP